MAQACDGYSKGSLMGNWYEERLAPAQPCRDLTAGKTIREEDASISVAADTSQLKPLPRIQRQPYWVTKGVTADDGFREFRSNHDTQLDLVTLKNYYRLGDQRSVIKTYGEKIVYPENSKHHLQTQAPNQYKIINQDNLEQNELFYDNPSEYFPLNLQGMSRLHVQCHKTLLPSTPQILAQHFASMNQHTSNCNTSFDTTFCPLFYIKQKIIIFASKSFGKTSYQNNFGEAQKSGHKEIIDKHENQHQKFAGTNERPYDQQSIRAISTLTGELHKQFDEPKDNTAIQRQWLPQADKAIVYAQHNIVTNVQKNQEKGLTDAIPMITYKKNMQQILPYDIATSLPVGEGEYALKPKYTNPGQFRHVRSEITRVMNAPLTKK